MKCLCKCDALIQMTFIGGCETINVFKMLRKRDSVATRVWAGKNTISSPQNLSVSQCNTANSQPLQRKSWTQTAFDCMVLSPALFHLTLNDNFASVSRCRCKIHITICMRDLIYVQRNTRGGGTSGGRGQSGASLLRLQPRRHTVIRSASVHRSCQLLPPSEASRCCDACLQTSAVRRQPGCWRPDRTPSTPPEILIVCHEGWVWKKGQVLEGIYHLCFNTWSLDSSLMCKVHTLLRLEGAIPH